MYLTGVSHKFNNTKSRRANPTRDRKHKVAHYLDEDRNYYQTKEGFFSFYYKKFFATKWKVRKFICSECQNVFQALIKNDRMKVSCPKCL